MEAGWEEWKMEGEKRVSGGSDRGVGRQGREGWKRVRKGRVEGVEDSFHRSDGRGWEGGKK
jgi:hypothetical protein